MTNAELQALLKKYPDDTPIIVNHPDGDWDMVIVGATKYDEDEETEEYDHLRISTAFREDD